MNATKINAKSDFDTVRDAWTAIIVEGDEALSKIEALAGHRWVRTAKQHAAVKAAKIEAMAATETAMAAVPALHGWTTEEFDTAMDEETERMNALTD